MFGNYNIEILINTLKKLTLKRVLRQRLEGPAGELLCEIARHYRRWQAGQESLSAYPYIQNS